MKDKALLAAAMAGGYVLGRTKKGRFALGVGSYMLTRRHNVDPKQLAVEGARRLGAAPQVSRLTGQVRGELAQAGKTALSAAMQRQVGALADRIDRRADELVGGGRSSEAPEKAPEKESDEGGGDGPAEDSDSTQASESAADSEAE
ncbi:MAG TPA: histone protein, partial [Yinghuangia sp.]|nr:histone protein [Yinghuangia sp.]